MNRNQYLLDYHNHLNLVMETKLKCKQVSEMHTRLLNALKLSNASGEFFVDQVVKNVLGKYDADKTGLADYALETAGNWLRFTGFCFSSNLLLCFFFLSAWQVAVS